MGTKKIFLDDVEHGTKLAEDEDSMSGDVVGQLIRRKTDTTILQQLPTRSISIQLNAFLVKNELTSKLPSLAHAINRVILVRHQSSSEFP